MTTLDASFSSDIKGPKGEPNLPDLADVVTSHAGWYWDLPLSGERVVSDVLLRDGRLIVIGFTPNPDRCSDGGTSFFMELNSFSGGNAGKALIDINNDGVIDGKDFLVTTAPALLKRPRLLLPGFWSSPNRSCSLA